MSGTPHGLGVGNYPLMERGIGLITPPMWARIMGMLEAYETQATANPALEITSLRSAINGLLAEIPFFLAKITGSTAISANKYKYAWTEVLLDGSSAGSVVTKPGGLSGTTGDGFALNLCELNNTSSNVSPGVCITGCDYPAGFTMRAIGDVISGGTDVDTVVVMFNLHDDEGGLQPAFLLANAHDGDCTA